MKLFGISFKKLIFEQFRYILIAVAVIILVVGYVIIIGPELNEIRQLGLSDRNTEQKLLEDRGEYLTRVEEMLDRYDDLNKRSLEELDQVLPKKSDIADLFVIVDDLVEQSDLQLNSIAIAPASLSQPGAASSQQSVNTGSTSAGQNTLLLNTGLKSFDISISVSGGRSYEHFKEFLTNIENSLRIFNVQSLNFNPAQALSRNPGELTEQKETYTINMRTFYFEEET
ncbi:MAG: hypothetical protein V1853_05050 [bacterium]